MMKIARRPGLRTTFKAATVVVMLLLMLIPLSMIRSLVSEREYRALEAGIEIIDGAGGSLVFVGPLLVLPYEIEVLEEYDGQQRRHKRRGEVVMLAEHIIIDGRLEVEYRSRGIYRVPVYRIYLNTDGSFISPDSDIFPDGAIPLGNENRLVVGIGDMRGIKDVSPLLWSGEAVDFGPDAGHPSLGTGIAAAIGPLPAPGTELALSWNMEIGGGGSVSVAPLGRDSELLLSGNWPSPSFQGALLPDERELDETSFQARWRIPEVSRPIRPHWDSADGSETPLGVHSLTVELLEPVGAYARTERSVKYGALFLLIPFVVFFLFETLGKLRVHPVQYLLAAVADILFYLLLLALSEHLGFSLAYISASLAVTLLISFYTRSITGRMASSLAMPLVLIAAYIWLWVTLQSEDYALLIGAIGLFVIVALVMILTRKVDWYASELSIRPESGPKGNKGESGQLDVLPAERNTDDGDGKQQSGDRMEDSQFPTE